jgi:regulator of protease activity HflC (stomatin/prohibitin superfamily)
MRTIDMDDTNSSSDGGSRPEKRPRRSTGGGRRISASSVLTGIAALFAVFLFAGLGASGNLGFVTVTDSEVAVKLNYMTGTREVITTPGIKTYIPFLQAVFKVNREPQRYMMEGNKMRGDSHAPFLTVRARDGSNFWFESLEIQYMILPSKAGEIIDDSGLDDGFKRDWVRAFARSILRDEFGRFSAVEVADPSSYRAARVRSTERMNEYLNPHGVNVLQIITPKPRFDPKYEQAIEDRKEADQDVERLKELENQLTEERGQQLALVEKEKEIEWQGLQGDLARERKEAERESILVMKGADRYKVTREAEGKAERDRFTAQAEGLTAKYTKEAEGIRARAAALEQRGSVVVREALIDKLSSIRFTLVPYSRDPSPKRLEHLDGNQQQRASSGDLKGGN